MNFTDRSCSVLFVTNIVLLGGLLAAANSRLEAQTATSSRAPPDGTQSGPPADAAPRNASPPRISNLVTPAERFRIYTDSTFRPMAFLGPALGAALSEWITGNPPEWDQGLKGYGRRFASGFGRNVVSNTITFGVALADGEDPRLRRSDSTGIWARARFAMVQTFVSRTESGRQIPAFSRFAGAYGAAFVSNAWYPAKYDNTKQALYRGSTALASSVAFHVFYEFLPDLKRVLRRK